MQSTKEKLDNLLGISSESSIDDFLDDISTQTDEISSTVSSIDSKIKSNVSTIDAGLSDLSSPSTGGTNILDMAKINDVTSNIESSLKEVKELIDISKKLILHVYSNIITTDLVDSELIESFAKLIESTRINIADYLELYKSRLAFYDKVRFSVVQQQQKIELLNLKHKLDMERITAKPESESIEVENMKSYNQEDIVKILNKKDNPE